MRHYLLALWIHPKYMIGYNYSLLIENGESHILRANKILNQLGYHHFNSPMISLSQETIDKSFQLIKDHINPLSRNPIALIIGGRWESKTYPAEKYRELAEKLIEKYDLDIVLLGTDFEMGNTIANGKKKIQNLTGVTTIQEVMGLIYQSRLVIGPDSGLLNMAIAMDKPIVGLFGPVDPHTIVPDKYLNCVLYQNKCELQPCFNEEYQPQCPYEKIPCMDFRVEDIISKVDEILSLKKNRLSIQMITLK
ncbi:glycosyltransferase family 9 protein [bacterium]|nr:glycosyltransferase family 9 protein [bacterium]